MLRNRGNSCYVLSFATSQALQNRKGFNSDEWRAMFGRVPALYHRSIMFCNWPAKFRQSYVETKSFLLLVLVEYQRAVGTTETEAVRHSALEFALLPLRQDVHALGFVD